MQSENSTELFMVHWLSPQKKAELVPLSPSLKENQLLCPPCGTGLPTRGAQLVFGCHKHNRGLGGCSHVYRRCAWQLCLLLCRVLQGNPGTQQLLQEGRIRAGSAGRALWAEVVAPCAHCQAPRARKSAHTCS